ncbi:MULTISPECIES: chemotaxis protein CheD [Gracilibacillus]|uniref:chemotaxis protein CheD n=1 Tax=Gracilibacillus TaxID=74385 RepID=UPI000824AEFA|nr:MULTISPECIES: chemotaxis protein CheD [Gracilibacillus]
MTLTKTIIKVGIADLKVTEVPNSLKTSGLGSCVGVVIYNKQLAGMAHVMLPNSTTTKKPTINKMKYADTAIDLLMKELLDKGARRAHLKAKIAGGAHMFSMQPQQNMLKIGERNIEAVQNKLREHQVKVIAQDVGGSKGRTIEFHVETGIMDIRTVHGGVSQI